MPSSPPAPRLRLLARGVVGALAVTALLAGPAAAANAAPAPAAPGAGSIGIRLVDAPVTARDDPRARVYIVDHLNPGAVIHRRIEVSNTTASTAHVALYPAAASITKGSFVGASAHTPNDLTTWTSVSPGEADVPAGGKVMSTVTVTVPKDAAPGEQYGVIWAETRSAPKAGSGVVQVSRVGIRLYVSVGPGGAPASGFSIDSLTAQRSSDGRPMVLADVHNTGGRALDMNGSLQLTAGPGGLSAGPFPATLGTTLAIGDTETVTIPLDKALPAGPWDASITLHSGLLDRSAKATITFPARGTAGAVRTTSAGRPGWLYPAIGAALALVLLGTAAQVVRMRRRRHPVDQLPQPQREPARLS